jgi:hypothetical protein
MYGTMRTAYIVFAGKPEGTRPLGRPRSRWEDIKMEFKETGWVRWATFIWFRIGTSGELL